MVFPAPFGPKKANTSPHLTEKEISFTAIRSSYSFLRFVTIIAASFEEIGIVNVTFPAVLHFGQVIFFISPATPETWMISPHDGHCTSLKSILIPPRGAIALSVLYVLSTYNKHA